MRKNKRRKQALKAVENKIAKVMFEALHLSHVVNKCWHEVVNSKVKQGA